MEELYSQKELLERVFKKMENVSKKNFSMKVRPEIKRQNRKTFILNFIIFSDSINRDKNHIKSYIDKELKTSSSINDDGMLIINNTYNESDILKLLTRYAQTYIICREPSCNSGDTIITKENSIVYLACNSCKSQKAI